MRASGAAAAIGRRRVANQLIDRPIDDDPAAVVRHFGAMQAQDYLGALWAVGLRLRGGSERSVETALAERRIVRTWPMRGTLHFVAAEDARWMLELLTGRVLAGSSRRHQELELDRATFVKSGRLFERALRDGRQRSRPELYQILNAAGIATHDARGLHLLAYHAQHRLICFAARAGKQQTFALFDEWIPEARPRDRDGSRAELAARYFTSHGPATANDFAWWSGLTVTEARRAVELAGDRLEMEQLAGRAYWSGASAPSSRGSPGRGAALLPPFDELTVAYRDRSAVLDPAFAKRLNGGGGMMNPTVLIGGRVVGTWKRGLGKAGVTVSAAPFAKSFTPLELRGVASAARRYARYLDRDLIGPG
jgi:YD repeat-containing protein